MMDQIFSDVRVLDLTWYISGPYCTKLFADYGAEVIKIERPDSGDPARRLPPFLEDDPHPEKSLVFSHLNLNKRSLTLNLKSEQGREIFKALVKEAHILVENFRPGVMARLGLDYQTLREINPTLVMTSISNFGQTGPYRDFELSELVLNGFHSMIHNGLPDRYPLKKGGRVCLYQGGQVAALATLGAFWASEEQSLGQHVDVSLMETQAGDVDRKNIDLLAWAYSGGPIHAIRTDYEAWRSRNVLPFGIFPSKDGFVVSLPLLNHWPRFIELMDRPDLEAVFQQEGNLFDLDIKGEMDVMWYEWLASRTSRQAMEESQNKKFFVTALQSPKEVVEDPHFSARGMWVEVEHPVTGRRLYPGAPVEVGPGSWQVRRPAPLLSQHTAEILGERLGYSSAEVDRLRAAGVV
jgi:crotonobetainyl-CoA:carnitine CoA-transferase CaiB-like acyl-CoA transferase